MGYVGVSPVGTFGTGTKDRFSGNNSTTNFTMSRSVGDTTDIDGGTDIGEALTTSDLIVVDNGAGGTNRTSALSRMVTLMAAKLDDPTALAIALG